MKALITTACWGDPYIDALARFSAASFLSPGNIPAAAARHELTWQLMAPRADLEAFLATEACKEIARYCTIDAMAFEDEGIEIGKMPVGFDNNKYSFLSNIQNLAMRRAVGHDVLLFNYADCLWQEGSLPYAIDRIQSGETDVILTLGIPVDDAKGKLALEPFRHEDQPGQPLILPPRQTARLIFDNLHSETTLRYWEGEKFTNTPTYLIWDVPGEGKIVRCVHQTIVAMRVQPDDPVYQAGIVQGSLDGNFSAIAIKAWPYEVVTDTDKLALFSLYDSAGSSQTRPGIDRSVALKMLMMTIPPVQRNLLLEPLLFRYGPGDPDLWSRRIEESEEALRVALENKGSKFLGSILLATFLAGLLAPRKGAAKIEVRPVRHPVIALLSDILVRIGNLPLPFTGAGSTPMRLRDLPRMLLWPLRFLVAQVIQLAYTLAWILADSSIARSTAGWLLSHYPSQFQFWARVKSKLGRTLRGKFILIANYVVRFTKVPIVARARDMETKHTSGPTVIQRAVDWLRKLLRLPPSPAAQDGD